MIALSPLMSRPNFFVVRVDAKWTLSNWDDGDNLIDHLDGVYEAIEDAFGFFPNEDDDDYDEWNLPEFPVADLGFGCAWDEIDMAFLRMRRDR